VVLPTGDIKIQDGALTTGAENYKEFWYNMVSLASEGQNFDGNGMYVRFQPGGGTQTVSVGPGSLSGDTFFSRQPEKPIGTRPAYPGKRPPYKPDVPCYTQKIPDLDAAKTGPPDASTPSSSSGPAAATPAVPTAPVTPPVASPRSAESTSVAGELLDRLNPFRPQEGGR
jgi:hypothetical protein